MGGRGSSFKKFGGEGGEGGGGGAASKPKPKPTPSKKPSRLRERLSRFLSRRSSGGGADKQKASSKPETPKQGRVREPALKFTGKASVEITNNARRQFAETLGRRNVSDKDIVKMFGVPNGGRVSVSGFGNSFTVRISHPTAQGISMSVIKDGRGRLTLVGDYARRENASSKPTAGLEMMRNLVSGISSYGFKRFEIGQAAGSKMSRGEWTGYKSWVRMGFNTTVSRDFRRRIQQDLGIRARTVQELFQKGGKRGEDWWRDNGISGRVRFDLRAGSTSRRRLNEQINFFNIRGLKNV